MEFFAPARRRAATSPPALWPSGAACGLKLNYPEAMALISAARPEGARDGRTVAEPYALRHHPASREQVMKACRR